MRRFFVGWILVGMFLWSARPGWTDEPAKPAKPPLIQRLEELARVDDELTKAKQEIEQATTPEARQPLKARIQELEARLDQLLDELQGLLGPPPPAVSHESPTSLEQQLESHQRRHDAILESDVNGRLSR